MVIVVDLQSRLVESTPLDTRRKKKKEKRETIQGRGRHRWKLSCRSTRDQLPPSSALASFFVWFFFLSFFWQEQFSINWLKTFQRHREREREREKSFIIISIFHLRSSFFRRRSSAFSFWFFSFNFDLILSWLRNLSTSVLVFCDYVVNFVA